MSAYTYYTGGDSTRVEIRDSPTLHVDEHSPLTITPPKEATGKELFSFPGVNWFEFFRDSVVHVAQTRLNDAYLAMKPLHVEPGNFDRRTPSGRSSGTSGPIRCAIWKPLTPCCRA